MDYTDSIKLLKECDAGSKMAVSSIDEVLDKTTDIQLKHLLQESKARHEKLGNEIHAELQCHDSDEKDPAVMAKSMAWMKTNMKLAMDQSDAMVADLITDGCDMGVKSLYKYLNQYKNADARAKYLCEKLISIEEELRKELRRFL